MVQRRGGSRRKSRDKAKKPLQSRGKISLRNYYQLFKEGDKVILKPEPAVQKGTFHLRFQGKAGIISGTAGKCYMVSIMDGNKQKRVIVHPIHLKRA